MKTKMILAIALCVTPGFAIPQTTSGNTDSKTGKPQGTKDQKSTAGKSSNNKAETRKKMPGRMKSGTQ